MIDWPPETPESGMVMVWRDGHAHYEYPPEYDPDDAEAQRIAEACADASAEHDRIENEEAGR